MKDLNYHNDDTNTWNSIQPKNDSTQNHSDTTDGELDQTSGGNKNLSPPLREMNQRTSLLFKVLKIKSQIGEIHQKDKLTYISSIHQINEIIISVIRAMSSSLTLRNVLETTSNLLSDVSFNLWSLILKKRVPQICVESWFQWFSYRKSYNIVI